MAYYYWDYKWVYDWVYYLNIVLPFACRLLGHAALGLDYNSEHKRDVRVCNTIPNRAYVF